MVVAEPVASGIVAIAARAGSAVERAVLRIEANGVGVGNERQSQDRLNRFGGDVDVVQRCAFFGTLIAGDADQADAGDGEDERWTEHHDKRDAKKVESADHLVASLRNGVGCNYSSRTLQLGDAIIISGVWLGNTVRACCWM